MMKLGGFFWLTGDVGGRLHELTEMAACGIPRRGFYVLGVLHAGWGNMECFTSWCGWLWQQSDASFVVLVLARAFRVFHKG